MVKRYIHKNDDSRRWGCWLDGGGGNGVCVCVGGGGGGMEREREREKEVSFFLYKHITSCNVVSCSK